jgi:hypothetical protein
MDFESVAQKVTEMEVVMKRIKTDLYNGEDGESGLVPELRAWMAEDRLEKRKRWTRSQKLAAVSIVTVCILPPCGVVAAKAINFFGDLYQITEEWHKDHQSKGPSRSFLSSPNPVQAKQSQTGEMPPTYQTSR